MPFLDLLTTDRVRTDLDAASKPVLLEHLSALLADSEADRAAVLDALTSRETLGSTGLGRGVAIPHGRMAGIDKARAAFVRLRKPLEFGSIDAEPVDLVAALVVPAHFTDQHLQLLAELAELFSDKALTRALRAAPDGSALRAELAEFARHTMKGRPWTD